MEEYKTGPQYYVLLGLDEGTVGILYNIPINDDDENRSIQETVRGHIKEMKARKGILSKAGIGRTYHGLSGMHESFKEAQKALLYADFHKGGDTTLYVEISKLKREFKYPRDLEKNLANYLKAGNKKNCLEMLSKIYEMNFGDPTMTFELAQCLVL